MAIEYSNLPQQPQQRGASQAPTQAPQVPAQPANAPQAPDCSARSVEPRGQVVRLDELTPAEIELRSERARKESILALAPAGLENVAQRCILEGLSLADSRKRMLDAFAQQNAPAGTPAPAPIDFQDAPNARSGDGAAAIQKRELSEDELVSVLKRS